jgi:hypothetical protein
VADAKPADKPRAAASTPDAEPLECQRMAAAALACAGSAPDGAALDALAASLTAAAAARATREAVALALGGVLSSCVGGVVARRGALLARLGPCFATLCAARDDATGQAAGLAADVCGLLVLAAVEQPQVAQFAVLAALSLAAGGFAEEHVCAAARKCLVALAQQLPEQVKQVVQGMPQSATERLQSAIRLHLAQEQRAH